MGGGCSGRAAAAAGSGDMENMDEESGEDGGDTDDAEIEDGRFDREAPAPPRLSLLPPPLRDTRERSQSCRAHEPHKNT